MANTAVIAELCIYILTWNVGTYLPKDISLSDMLSLNGTTTCPDNKLPDIYVLGFQEVNTNLKNLFMNLFRDDQWTLKIKEELSEHAYVKLATKQMLGILINVWTKPEHVLHVQDVEKKKTKTGLGGWWGNKGAVSVRLSLYGTAVTFVLAHLAADDENLKKRVADYNRIENKHYYKSNGYHKIFDHDVVFWFGDLNFRLDGKDSPSDIVGEIKLNKLDSLFARDQLSVVRAAGDAFALMDEQPPSFPPTYKFLRGTSDYSPKQRPAWCDRILYRVAKDKYPDIELELQQLSYKSHPQYTLSDHKPVTAEFLYAIKDKATNASNDTSVDDETHSDIVTESLIDTSE